MTTCLKRREGEFYPVYIVYMLLITYFLPYVIILFIVIIITVIIVIIIVIILLIINLLLFKLFLGSLHVSICRATQNSNSEFLLPHNFTCIRT